MSAANLRAARRPQPCRDAESGSMLIEAMASLALLAIVMAGLMSMDAVATNLTENQGHLSARCTEYAQDKIEQLMALGYSDTTSNTAVVPTAASGGTGFSVGGSVDPAAPVAGYLDYLDQTGQLLVSSGTTPPANWYYQRVWQTSTPTANVKQVSVLVTAVRGFGRSTPPRSTVVTQRAYPF